MPEQHALLSASSSSRWLVCTPSARLESLYPNGSSAYAEEGTKAHALAEKTLSAFLKGGSGKVECEDAEMREAVQRYVDTCIEKITAAQAASPDAVCGVEIRLNFSSWVPKGVGTGDCVLVSDAGIEVIDLKYGKGVPVHAEGNTQMRLYALGAYARYGLLFDTDSITMTIVQPRLDSISSDTLAMTVFPVTRWPWMNFWRGAVKSALLRKRHSAGKATAWPVGTAGSAGQKSSARRTMIICWMA